MPHGHVPGQPVAVPAGSGVPAHEAGVLHAAAGERDGHPPLGEEDLLTWRSQVEGQTCEMFTLNHPVHPVFHNNESSPSCDVCFPFFSPGVGVQSPLLRSGFVAHGRHPSDICSSESLSFLRDL